MLRILLSSYLAEPLKTGQMGKVFYYGAELRAKKSWDEAFEQLTKAFESISKDKKIVLFFNELPWMATKRSRLLQNLDYYWNQHWSNNDRMKLIVCGSSACLGRIPKSAACVQIPQLLI